MNNELFGRSLSECFVQAARKNWQRRCISDSTGRRLSYGRTLVRVITLSAELDKLTHGQEKVGILLPPSVGAALANLAVAMLGKVVVNLSFTASEQTIKSAVEQCRIKCIISSRSFVQSNERLKALPGLVFLEDITAKVRLSSKLRAYFQARFMPRRVLTKARSFCGDDLAAVVFSSGSSGEPKGVMLSHRNIISNIEALVTVFKLSPDDNLCGVLPFFHSFGFTCSLWLPVIYGVSASYVANPLDGGLVGQVARQNHSTILFAAPSFLLNYVRRTEPDDFASLRAVVVGAEKLRKHIADSFEAAFGIRPLEGYGTTELSPVVSLNLPEELSCGLSQASHKEGTVGRPVPGVEVKVVSIENNEPRRKASPPRGVPPGTSGLPAGRAGLLMVKGPNVMLGYLNKEKETAEVLKDGWYNTGDIASIDEDGFLTIIDRLSRFSKIAGEMVPHLGVERVYLRSLNTDEQVVAVTGVPERKKGEELVVLYLEKAGDADRLHEIVSKSELPNIWRPRKDNYIKIESMPALSSGKLDVMRLRKIALAAKNGSDNR